MAWTKGKRRNNGIDAAVFWQHLVNQVGLRKLAQIAGVDPRTVRRWSSGEDCSSLEVVTRVIESLCSYKREGVVGVDYALDGRSRIAGVGQYTIEAANGTLLKEVDNADSGDWS